MLAKLLLKILATDMMASFLRAHRRAEDLHRHFTDFLYVYLFLFGLFLVSSAD
jgi:hypothetical protein